MMFFDPLYFVFLAPGILLALYAGWKTKATFAKYSRVASSKGFTGAEAAHEMLRRQGISCNIERVNGMLTDHYDPRSRTLRLSDQVYGSRSLSAIGVACHEAGHAIQHAHAYAPLKIRSAMVPVTQFASTSWIWILMAGVFLNVPSLSLIAIALFSVAVVFSIVTLPVEWDATKRAKEAMLTQGIVSQGEATHAGKVLNAAFLTYLASAITAILTLLYYLLRFGLIGGSND